MPFLDRTYRYRLLLIRFSIVVLCTLTPLGFTQEQRQVPDHVPPKRSSQIEDGFGINSDLPREPYLPWNRWWWTRMFDAGFKWIRIGQYENSSDRTSWDWIEQKRGVLASSSELEDQVDSLVDNGMKIQVQLLYGNVMYTSPSGTCPTSVYPSRDRSITMTEAYIRCFGRPDSGADCGVQSLRNMDGEALPRSYSLLGYME